MLYLFSRARREHKQRRSWWLSRGAVCLLALMLIELHCHAASEHHGQVYFGGLPVPGATVTATQGDKQFMGITDERGVYAFANLEDGEWTFRVEMRGFATQTRDILVGSDAPSPVWELKLLPFEEITGGLARATVTDEAAEVKQSVAPDVVKPPNTQTPLAPAAPKSRKSQRTEANAPGGAAATQPPPGDATASGADSTDERAATGLLVNGSVNNGAASPFAQMAAFGNNRRGAGGLYNGGVGVIFDISAWDAAPYSGTGLTAAKPSYNDAQIVGALGGPFGIPHHLISGSNFFVAYQHASNDTAATQWGRVPSILERAGDFSETVNAAGQPVQIFNPSTGLPFPGNVIPKDLISSQALALLNLYPLPNVPTTGLYNDQATVLNSLKQDAAQARLTKSFGFTDQVFGNMAYQRGTTDARNLFGFDDITTLSGLDTAVNWSHRFRGIFNSNFFIVHFKYEFSRLATDVTPYFANRANISGNAGVFGNDQQPQNWGPPNLIFSSGVAGLSEPEYARNANQTNAFSYDTFWGQGRHNFMFGGDVRWRQFNIVSQQDARGTLAFTGAATQMTANGFPVLGSGSDLADFLLGIPDTASIAFGNADKYLRGWIYDAFFNDDWRINSGLTLNAGIRWEYAAPLTELRNRLVNLEIAPGFGAAAPVLASDPTGTISGQQYPNSLLRPDYQGIEPRIGVAWRPKPASALVIRAGYGVYDNTSVYQLLATQLAQQPPFSKTLSIQNSAANPLTLATAFNTVPAATPNTFAVDPNFRVGYAQNWNVSVQEDLPASLTMTATYLGTKGTRLMQESLPNTFPLGAMNPCPACPADFIYLSSNGNSIRQAGQIQLRRRLRGGWTALVQYTFSKSIDDASAFSGAGLTTTNTSAAPPATSNVNSASTAATASTPQPSASIAQNWLDLEAERGLSTFDQRHLVNFQLQYTSGEGLRGGAFLHGWAGSLLKEWTFTTQLTVASGLPLTPIYLTNVTGTGVVGTIRPNYTGTSVSAPPAGFFLNPAGYTAPAAGQWGNAGRDSITGPSQFALNASIGRTFRLSNRLNADWRIDATNALNVVTYTAWNTAVNSPLFGLPSQANPMRKLQTTLRVRF